jgi:hypothetical protein
MSFGINDPVTGELAENKANKDGSDLTNPQTWRGALGVYSTGETNTRLNALAPRQGVVFAQQLANTDAATSLLLTNPDAFTLYWEGVITRYPTANSTQPLIGNARGTATVNTGTFSLACNASGVIIARNDITGSDFESESFGYTAPLNTPLSLALTLDKATRVTRLFVNGVQVGGDQTFDSLTITSTTVSVKLMSAVQADIDAGRNVNGVTYRAGILNFAAPATTTSGVVGVAERYASGVWVQPSEQWGAAIIYPTIQNGGFETAGSPLADWTVSTSGTSAVTRDTVEFFSGTASAKIVLDGSASAASIRQDSLISAGRRYRVEFYAKQTGGFLLRGDAPGLDVAFAEFAVADDWTKYTFQFTAVASGFFRLHRGVSAAADSVCWIDDVTLVPLGSTLDLTPIGVGRVLIDRSASRNHAIVSGTVHPEYLIPRLEAEIRAGYINPSTRVSVLEASNILPVNAIVTEISGTTDAGETFIVTPSATQNLTLRQIQVQGSAPTLNFFRGNDVVPFATVGNLGSVELNNLVIKYRIQP